MEILRRRKELAYFLFCAIFLVAKGIARVWHSSRIPDSLPRKELSNLTSSARVKHLSTPSLNPDKEGNIRCAFFSPTDALKELLIECIKNERVAIRAAIFMLTDEEIAQALITAHNNGIKVEIITEGANVYEKSSKIPKIQRANIPIFVYRGSDFTRAYSNIMHHKFAVFDKNIGGRPLLWTGSFNWTRSASLNNQENVIVLNTPTELIAQYKKRFAELKKQITTC